MSNEKSSNTKRGFKHVHLTSTLSMSLVLFLVGLVSLLLFMAHDMTKYVKENLNMSIVLNDNIGKQYEQRIEKYLLAAPFTKSIKYISKEEALKEHIANLGEDPEKFLGYNPLLASIEVKLNEQYACLDSVAKVETKLKTFENINRIVYQKDMVAMVNENVKKISFVLLSIAGLLLFVSVALIYNTIRLTLYSNRFLINTMKLVGATNWFIRKPYLFAGMMNGLVAAITSLVLLVGAVYFVGNEFGMSTLDVQPFVAVAVAGVVLLLGILISAISVFFAVGKYLRMTSNDLYML